MTENQTNKEGGTTVYVDDQPVTVDESELTIRRLLELAGATPESSDGGEAVLRELRGGQEIKHEDLEETITVSEEARFYTRNSPTGGGQSEKASSADAQDLETGTTPKTGGVNASSFAGAGNRAETPGASPSSFSGSTPNPAKDQPRGPTMGGQQPTSGQRGPNSGGQGASNAGAQQKTGGNAVTGQPAAAKFAGAETSTQRGSTSGSNVASGTGVRRETESPQRGTNPGQTMQNPKTGVQQGSSIQGAKKVEGSAEQTRQAFNEGDNPQQGSRRSGERADARPGERKKEEQKT